jgi:C1A family cysteine protease
MLRLSSRSRSVGASPSPLRRRLVIPAAACVLVVAIVLALSAGLASAASTTAPAGAASSGGLNPAFVADQVNPHVAFPFIGATGRVSGLRPSPQDLSYSKGMQVKAFGALTALPSSYDLRTVNGTGRLTPIRDQGSYGTCWTFASFGSLESYLMPGDPNDFSEDNLALTSGFNLSGGSYMAGGNLYMSTAYLTRWGGPVYQSEDAYGDSVTPSGLTAHKHVQQVDWLPARASASDNDNIKNAVTQNGGVYVAMYWSNSYYKSATAGYYCNATASANHAVVIVGWDDNYAASNFATAPAGNGAFIVRNSWGTAWGQAGYFYVSYYDTVFGRTDLMASFDNAEATTNYSGIYQYDPLGDVNDLGYGTTTAWFANAFKAQASGSISAVGFYTLSPGTTYSVYTGASLSALSLNTSGTMTYMGFHTVTLPAPLAITSGQSFVVAVKVTSPGSNYPVAVEYAVANYSSAATAAAGQSYISSNGTSWSDITTAYSSTANVCLKAYAGGTVAAGPTISGLSPAYGSLAGNNAVVITGNNFKSGATVAFGGIAALSVSVGSATQITAVAPPAAAAGTVQVQVTTADGATSNTAADDYTYVGVPTITSISPTSGPTTGTTSVVINGTGFVGMSGGAAVTFGGVNATSYTVNSSTKITAVAPAATAAGSVQVRVTAVGGQTANTAADDYTYTVAPTRYQQNATGITYTGTWSTVSTSSASGSSYTRSSSSSASAAFAFNGTSVSLIATKGSSMGKANVSIDGGTATVVDLSSTSTAVYQQTVFAAAGLTAGLHTVKITWYSGNTSGKYIDLDAVDIVGTIATAQRVEQTDSHLQYATTWTTVSGSSYSGSSIATVNAASSVTIKFTGASLNVIAAKARAYGKMSISLDGGTATTVDLYSYSTSYKQTVWKSGLLVPGSHTVKITWLSTKNSSATGTTIDLDGVDLIGALQ